MHEYSLAHDILRLVEDAARRECAQHVSVIGLRVGAFSGVVVEALESALELAKVGTLAEQARLIITMLPVIAYCQRCQHEFEVHNPYMIARCPSCATVSQDLRQGQELEVSYLEVN